jgi:glycosyltransferase involved in cell wall biosynthesis
MAPAHHTSPFATPSVLFVSGLTGPEDGSRLYRCIYHGKQLGHGGIKSKVVLDDDATVDMLSSVDVVVMARCKLKERTLALARAARATGKLLCGELDDKVFEPWDVDASGYLRSKALIKRDLAASGRVALAERNILSLLPLFEVVLVSTPGLKDALGELGIGAHVARNAIDTDVARPIKRPRDRLSSILVMSGTRTHDADLRMIALPLARFLWENPAVRCTFLGPFQLPCPLRGLPNVEIQERLPIAEFYPSVAKYDLCLVPLEDSAFNDCKSAIKFIECGVVSVPVVASPRREFRDLVVHNETGFLVPDEPDAWYQQLVALQRDPGLLQSVAARAHEAVLSNHTVASRGTVLADYFKSLLSARSQRRATKANAP